jgi:8-oxo-dGTP pyrophosphatase MutT (NUDIX family)
LHIEHGISRFLRHIEACNNAVLPGGRLAFRLGEQQVGWVRPSLARILATHPSVRVGADDVRLDNPAALQTVVRWLAKQGVLHWRGEAFDVRAEPGGPALTQIDRGALPAFGIEAVGVHLNGLVERGDEPHLWVARRAADKALDPGKFDHLVAGGVPAGLTPEETLVKEAAEEAGVSSSLARQAMHVGVIRYMMGRPEGLRRDLLQCYDLILPEAFRPYPHDGEVEAFELWPLSRVVKTVRTSDAFKFNVNLVLIDLFLRRGLFRPDDAVALRSALSQQI